MTTTALAVIAPPSLRDIVNQIQQTRELINDLLVSQDKEPMFVESKLTVKYRAKMATPCVHEDNYTVFVYDLNKYVRGESKGGPHGKSGYRLGEFKNHPFVHTVANLRNKKAHEEDDDKFNLDESLKAIYTRYLGRTTEPETEKDFRKMQDGLLLDCEKFMVMIYQKLSPQSDDTLQLNDAIISGVIGRDVCKQIYCENVLLPYSYGKYVGCKCEITAATENTRPSKKYYQYYSFSPDRIYINREGLVRQGDDGKLYCDRIAFDSCANITIGQKVKIDAIRATIQDGSLIELADEFEVLPDDYMLRSEADIDLNTEYEVQIDEFGQTHVGNVYIGKGKDCLAGDVVKITKIRRAPKQKSEKANSYPFIAADLEMVYDANGITKIYTVAKDDAGLLHADNILMPEKIKCQEGDRIMIFQIVENTSEDTNEIYPLMAHKAVVLNTSLPGAELKAEAVVSKYEKYVKPGLKWLASVFVAIIIIILGRGNLIQKD